MKKFKISNGLKNIGKISSGTLLGQLIAIVSLPILTRLYGSEIIGYMTLFTSIATVINSFSDLGLTNAIMIAKNEEKSYQIYKVVSSINFFISIISFFIIPLIYSGEKQYNPFFIGFMVSIIVLTQQQIQISYTWLNKNQKYNILMKNPVINQVSIFVIAVGLYFIGVNKYGYFIGTLVGQLLTLINMKRCLPKSKIVFNLSKYKNVINENKDFVFYQLPTTILTNVKNQLPTFLINNFFGTTILGYYSITQKILNIPINLLANAIGKVFFSNISKMVQNGEKIGEYVFQNLKRATYISIVPITLLISLSNIAIYIIMGYFNDVASQMLQASSIQAIFTFLMASLSGIYIVIKKQNYALKSVIAQMLGYIIGFGLGKFIFNDVVLALYITTIIYSIIQIVYFCFIFKAMNISPMRYLKNVILCLLLIITSSAILSLVFNHFFEGVIL